LTHPDGVRLPSDASGGSGLRARLPGAKSVLATQSEIDNDFHFQQRTFLNTPQIVPFRLKLQGFFQSWTAF
jgi:hypothetical protein